jgi:hypothetical protein
MICCSRSSAKFRSGFRGGFDFSISLPGGNHETSCSCALTSFAIGGAAADPTCHDQAAGKKLSGAALTSFMKKCEKDAATACDAQAAEKKLSGAAKTSFTKKCAKDSTGT